MKFHAMLAVRDEADILPHCLRHLQSWADAVYVFDTGSVDNSWEIVQDFAAQDRRIVPIRKDAVYFTDASVRGWLFNEVRGHMTDGDWFLRVDADEVYHVTPPEFVRTRLSRHETNVWHQYYDFRLTTEDVEAWESGRESLADRVRPIEQRRRWFTPSRYSEPRLCRYRSSMKWPITCSFPFNAGYVARARLPIRHYPHRDPVQLDRRSKVRAFMIVFGGNVLGTHYQPSDIGHSRNLFTQTASSSPASGQSFSTDQLHDEWRRFVVPMDFPEMQQWDPATPLPDYWFTNHIAPPAKRFIQYALHRTVVRLVDRFRPAWRREDYPARVPEDLSRALAETFGSSSKSPK